MEEFVMKRLAIALFAGTVSLLFVGSAVAQSAYPRKTIRVVSPYAAGGSSDYMARLVASVIAKGLKQTVIVENKPGAGGMLGTDYVAKAASDGYTFLYGSISTHAIAPLLYENIPYNALKDFTPVTTSATAPSVLVVLPSTPVRSVKDLIAFTKGQPDRLTYGSSGVGSMAHLTTQLFMQATSTQMLNVSYKGDAPALADLMGGQIDFMFGALPSAMTIIRSGRIRALAVSSAKRSPIIPDVPTVAESGVPGFEMQNWWMFFSTANLPAGILSRVNAVVVQGLKSPELVEKFRTQGIEPFGDSPSEAAKYLISESNKWSKIFAATGIKKLR